MEKSVQNSIKVNKHKIKSDKKVTKRFLHVNLFFLLKQSRVSLDCLCSTWFSGNEELSSQELGFRSY